MYTYLTLFKQEVMVIMRVLKWFEISLLDRGEGGVGKWSDEEWEKGGDEWGDLLQSEFSSGSLSLYSESS